MLRAVDYTEETLISGLRHDDEAALAYLYKKHYPMVAHFIQSNSGSEDEAKDIFQESILVLYEKLKESTFELTCQIKTYLYSVARRLWLKKLAEKNRFAGVLDSESFVSFDDDDDGGPEEIETQFVLLEETLNKIGEPCRTLLEDFYLRAQSMQSITEKFGYTNPDNAKNQKYKCLMRLKKLFFAAYKTAAPNPF